MFGTPIQGLRNNSSCKFKRIQRGMAQWCLPRYINPSSATNMLKDLGWRTLEQRWINSRLSALFKITWGFLHPAMRRTTHSHSDSFIPLEISLSSDSVYPFSQSQIIIQWNNLPASVFIKHCSLDTFKAHVSCLDHLPVD